MSDPTVYLDGTVHPDGRLELDEKVTLPPGRVRVAVQAATSSRYVGPPVKTEEPGAAGAESRFRRQVERAWFLRGGAVGAALGASIGLAVYFLLVSWPSGTFHVGEALQASVLGGLLLGAAGAAATVLWWSILHPVLLALFSSERFLRVYGTPEERGMLGCGGRPKR
jgi:hypothetical protein